MDAGLRERLAGMARAVLENDLERKPTPQIDPPEVGRLGEVQSPTLVIVGDADVEAIVNIADVIASGIRGARKLVLPDTAHMVNLERPAQFNRAVVEFPDEHPIAS
jgi:pimeloyl-ACP methyl ester carboxylesterase